MNNEKKPDTRTKGKQDPGADKKCCIATCTKWKTEAVSLYPIPSNNAVIQMRWFNFIRKSRGLSWTPSDDKNAPLVCSIHFQDKSFYFSKSKSKILLRPNACPTFQHHPRRLGPDSKTPRVHDQSTYRNKDVPQKDTNKETHSSSRTLPEIAPNRKDALYPQPMSHKSNQKLDQPVPAFQPLPTISLQNSVQIPQLPVFLIPSITQPIPRASPANVLQPINYEVPLPTGTLRNSTNSELPLETNSIFGLDFPNNNMLSTMTFCLICNQNLEDDKEGSIDTSEQKKAREILLKTLNIDTRDLEISENHSICYPCTCKVLDFQVCIDILIENQKNMEKQRNDLLAEIVTTYCKRMSSKTRGYATFLKSNAVHQLIVKKWASTLSPPFVRTDPPCDQDFKTLRDDFLTEIRQKESEQRRSRQREKNKAYYDEKERLKLEKQARRQYRDDCRREAKARRLRGEKMKKKQPTEKAECTICKKEILKVSLKSHMKTHGDEREYRCDVCSKTFLREGNLKSHQLSHGIGNLKFGRADRVYQCKYCEKQIRHGKSFFRHLTTHFGKEIEKKSETMIFYHCDDDDCVISISDVSKFQTHLLTHSRNPLACASCSKHFASAKNLELHQNVHSANETSLHDCQYCHDYFETEEALSTHHHSHQIHVDLNAFNVKCNLCNETFACELHCQQHRQKKHRGEPESLKRKYQQLMCEVCGAEFNAESRLRMHCYEHTNPEGFPCESCKQIFPNPTKLWAHNKKQNCEDSNQLVDNIDSAKNKRNSGEKLTEKEVGKSTTGASCSKKQKTKLFSCRLCTFVSRGSNHLFRRHCLLSHPEQYVNDKPFFCRVCWHNYPTQESLSDHQKDVHSRYTCHPCNRVFGNIVRLQLHNRIHTGEKPYKCQHCDKRFTLEPNLREHENRHTGARPYVCKHCDAGFLRKKQMMQHIEDVHPAKDV